MLEEEKENGEEKGGTYFDKENTWSAGEKKNKEEKGQEYLRKTNIWSAEDKKSGEGKDDKYHGKGKVMTDRHHFLLQTRLLIS